MDRKKELEKEFGKLTVQKQELENKLRALEGKAEEVSGLKEPPRIIITQEKLDEIESIRREIEVIEARKREIIEEKSKLPRK